MLVKVKFNTSVVCLNNIHHGCSFVQLIAAAFVIYKTYQSDSLNLELYTLIL